MSSMTDINNDQGMGENEDGFYQSTLNDDSDTASGTSWEGIALMITWLVAASMLVALVVSCARIVRNRPATSTGMTNANDEESQTKHDGTFPARPTGVLPVLATVIGFSLSVAAQTSCKHINAHEVKLDERRELDSLGLWSAAIYDGHYGSNHQCQSIQNGFPVDMSIDAARTAAIIASFLGGICMISAMYCTCSRKLDSIWFRRLTGPLVIAAVAQLLVLVLLSTDVCDLESACTLDFGGIASITAAGYWIIATLGVASVSSAASV